MRKRAISIVLIIFLLFSLAGCQVGTNDNQKEQDNDNVVEDKDNDNDKEDEVVEYRPVFGGNITVPLNNVETLNPLLDGNLSMYYFNKLIFEGLFEFDENLNVKPLLAESYKISEDGRKINIKLRENVLWHDGERLTAKDVEFTLNTLKYGVSKSEYFELLTDVYKPASPSDLQHILNINIIDDFNIQIVFDRSYSNSLESLIIPIIPRHRFSTGVESEEEQYQKALETANYEPIGTGPYKFKDYKEYKEIELFANESWWKGNVFVEEITGKIFNNYEVAVSAFESNIIDLTPAIGVDWEKYSQNNNINIYDYISQDYAFLGFNFRNEIFAGEKGKALRKAIAFGINRESIIKNVYLGHATTVDVPISPNSWLISDASSTYEYNVQKAKELLEVSGWKDNNNDGIYEDENGKNLSLRLLTNSYNELRRKTANMIADYLADIGIEIIKDYNDKKKDRITEAEAEEQWQEVVNKIYTGDFDITLLEWELSFIPDLAFAFHSSEIESGTNIIAYENESLDNLIVSAFKAKSREDKKSIYEELQEFLADELPYVSLYFKNSALLVNSRVKGDINPQSFNIYHNIENWYVNEEPIQ